MRTARRLVFALAAGTLLLASGSAGAAQVSDTVRVHKLMRPTPDWYTPELHQKVLAAPYGIPLPDGVDVPASGLAFTGIRPGAWMFFPAWCTMNFVFGTPGDYSIGTAGHCTEKVGEEVTLITIGPTSGTPVLVYIGDTIKTTGDGGIGNDFALISIRPEIQSWVSPAMAHWGGPTGAYTGTAIQPLVHSGHGAGIGTGGTPRTATSLYYDSGAAYWVGGTMLGDSGSAVNTAVGLAVAGLTHIIVDTRKLGADTAGTRITKILQIANKPLATCALPVPWPAPGCPT